MPSPLPTEVMPTLRLDLVGQAVDQQMPRVEVEALDLLSPGQEWPVRIAVRYVVSGSNGPRQLRVVRGPAAPRDKYCPGYRVRPGLTDPGKHPGMT